MKPTKQFILEKALELFNEKGFVNVRLQHIADAASISVGHLAYHFKNKGEIILALYKKLKKTQELLLADFRVLPLFEDIDFLMHNLFKLQEHYLFFYVDTLEVLRAFPEIAEKHRQCFVFNGSNSFLCWNLMRPGIHLYNPDMRMNLLNKPIFFVCYG